MQLPGEAGAAPREASPRSCSRSSAPRGLTQGRTSAPWGKPRGDTGGRKEAGALETLTDLVRKILCANNLIKK